MKLEDFIRNLRAIDEGHDLDPEMLAGNFTGKNIFSLENSSNQSYSIV